MTGSTELSSGLRRFPAFAVLCASFGVTMIAAAALPAEPLIVHQFSLPLTAGLHILVTSFVVGALAGLLTCGPLWRWLGPRRIEIAILGVLGAALLCGVAWSGLSLAIPRLVQGFASALVGVFALGFAAVDHPSERRVGLLGVTLFVMFAGSMFGSLAGTVLADQLTWRWCFLVALPVGAIVLAIQLLVRARAPNA